MSTTQPDDPWKGISKTPGAILGRRVDGPHPLSPYWAIDHHGAPGLLIKDLDGSKIPKSLPNPRGIALRVTSDAGCTTLSLFLQRSEDRDVFAIFCNDVIGNSGSTPTASEATSAVFSRLTHWQSLLARARVNELSEPEVRGLIAELWFLSEQLSPRLGLAAAIRAWVAPDQHPQDFALPHSIVEVKSKLSGSSPVVRISSLAQLQTENLPLFLFVCELTPADTDDAISLNALAAMISSKAGAVDGTTLDSFASALLRRGYVAFPRYDELRYLVAGSSTYEVTHDFPKLTRSATDPRIAEAAYAIELTSLGPFERALDDAVLVSTND